MSNKIKNSTKLSITALFISIILIQSIIPWLGNLPLGAFTIGASVTIITFTVAIGSMLLGSKSGLLFGFIWGLYSFWNAWTGTESGTIGGLIFRNPITSILCRMLVGYSIGYIFSKIKFYNYKTDKKIIILSLIGGLSAFLNTFFVLLSTWIFFNIFKIKYVGVPSNGLAKWLIISIAGFNGVFEIITGAIIVPIIGVPLLNYFKNNLNRY